MARACRRPSTIHTKQWSGRAEDEWTRDQDGMEEPAAQDENGTRRQYDSVEDAGVNHVGKINSKAERRRKYISKIHGNVDAVPGS